MFFEPSEEEVEEMDRFLDATNVAASAVTA
jgi:hypothetical protein